MIQPLPALLSGALVLTALPAMAAAPSNVAQAAVVKAVTDCRKLTDPAQRLTCYDAAVANMETAQAKGDLVTVDRQQRGEIRRQAFGLTLPSLSLFDKGEKAEDLSTQTFKVEAAGRGADGKLLITLEGGQVWRQIDDYSLFKPPHEGSVAVVRKAALGSFVMKIDGQQQIRVHRDR